MSASWPRVPAPSPIPAFSAASVCVPVSTKPSPRTGVYMINKKKCVSCGKCAEACPMHVIVFEEGSPASKCIACGICVKACPMELLEIVEK